MKRILKLKNPIMPYAWGSHKDLPRFLGKRAPSAQPQAELWMGAHSKAPSRVRIKNNWRSLDEVIQEAPDAFLGRAAHARFGPNLPFLFKVLAADQPLSIQAHPDRTQARKGFLSENRKNMELTDPRRNFKDDRHKPECICALTPFWGVCGFRPVAEMLPLLSAVWPNRRKSDLDLFGQGEEAQQVKAFFGLLMTLPAEELSGLLGHVGCVAHTLCRDSLIYKWIVHLQRQYPGDPGILSPILLNLICLQPGEALFLQAGQLHAYFGGMGIEIMANSDNVLRGGLTPKHVDMGRLLEILDFTPGKPDILKPVRQADGAWRYTSQTDEFALGLIDVSPQRPYACADARHRSPQILLCARGTARVALMEDKRVSTTLSQGEAALVPHAAGNYIVQGEARLYQAAVNLPANESRESAP